MRKGKRKREGNLRKILEENVEKKDEDECKEEEEEGEQRNMGRVNARRPTGL